MPYLRNIHTGEIYPMNEHLMRRGDFEPIEELPGAAQPEEAPAAEAPKKSRKPKAPAAPVEPVPEVTEVPDLLDLDDELAELDV